MRAYKFLGFTLIEVLISLFILSFLLFGFNGILLQVQRHTYDDYYFSIASQQMITIIERLHALGNAQGMNDQLTIWNQQNKTLLPKSEGMIEGTYPSYTITLRWGAKILKENVTV